MADIAEVLDGIAGRLAGIAAELDDLGFEQLRAAGAAGDPDHPAVERRLLKARWAVSRAVAALRAPTDDDPTPL